MWRRILLFVLFNIFAVRNCLCSTTILTPECNFTIYNEAKTILDDMEQNITASVPEKQKEAKEVMDTFVANTEDKIRQTYIKTRNDLGRYNSTVNDLVALVKSGQECARSLIFQRPFMSEFTTCINNGFKLVDKKYSTLPDDFQFFAENFSFYETQITKRCCNQTQSCDDFKNNMKKNKDASQISMISLRDNFKKFVHATFQNYTNECDQIISQTVIDFKSNVNIASNCMYDKLEELNSISETEKFVILQC